LAHSSAPGGGRAQTSSTDPIDRAYLARFTLGNAALEREVLLLFAAQIPLYVEQLRTAITRKAWKDAAHSIKGSALAVGAHRLASLAQVAEQLDVEGDPAHAVAALAASADEACRHIAFLFATA
jgi:HPt (histidine-containing phosphotransfer) domain-containing protein